MSTSNKTTEPGDGPSGQAPCGLNRRRFLQLGGCAAAGIGLAAGCSIPTMNRGRFAAGLVSDYALGDIQRFSAGPFFVRRDSGGLYAMSALCGHRACTLTAETVQISCGCHGTRYTLTGGVTRGPARTDLQHYQLEIDPSGELFVDTRVEIADDERVAVP